LEKVSGSIGLALRAAELGLEIIGADRDRRALSDARDLGILDRSRNNPLNVAKAADIIILSVPLSEKESIMELIGPEMREHTLVVDLSAQKGFGLDLAKRTFRDGHYIGASPVLAAEALSDGRYDVGAARADLFTNSVFCIMPSGKTDPEAVQTTVNLGRILGATPFFLDPQEYDSLMQGVETMPGLVSAAMFRSITQATGWRDMLRFAGSTFAVSTSGLANPNLAELANVDKAATLRWLDAILEQLQEMRRWLVDEEPERLSLILEDMIEERERWLYEREKNNWTEVDDTKNIGGISIAGQLFGFGARKSKDQ
jgi:prephenate dehydrogenase